VDPANIGLGAKPLTLFTRSWGLMTRIDGMPSTVATSIVLTLLA
jgi:hypothetical protein